MDSITIINGSDEFTTQRVGDMEGFEYPQVINVVEDVAKQVGALYITSKFGRRILSWQGIFLDGALEDRRELQNVCRAGSLKTIQFETCDGLELEAYVEFQRVIMPYKIGHQKYLLEAVAADPRFYSQEETEFSTDQTVAMGGLDIPADIPFDMDGEDGGGVSVTNQGTEYTDPIFRVDGPGNSFTIGNLSTGEEFQITYSLDVGDFIIINVAARTILLNGTDPIYSSLTSGSLWSLRPGVNGIQFVASAGDEDTLLTITFRDAYIGI